MKYVILFLVLSLNLSSQQSKYSDFVDAIYYEKKGDFKKSFEIIKRILENEKDLYLYNYLYNLAVKANMNDEAKKIIEKLIEIDSTTSDNWLNYGDFLSGEGKKEEAKAAYKKAVELDPQNIDAYYKLGVLESNNIKEAEKYFRKIIEIDPSYKTDIYYNIGVLYSMKNDEKKMIENMELAIKEDKYNMKPYYFLAMYWEEKSEYDKAINVYKRFLEVEENEEILNKIAELYLAKKEYENAEKYFLKTLEINQDNTKALWWLSLIEENRKNYQKAKEYLSKIKSWDNDVDAVLKMSYFNVMIGNLDETIRILENARQKWPQNYEIIYYLALGLIDKKDRSNDVYISNLLEVVVSSFPDNYEARFNLGVVCERLNDIKCFEDNFRYILSKKPDDATVLNYLGYSLIDRGLKLDEAIEMVEKAVKIEPENPAYLDSLAWGYYKKSDYQKAYEYIKKAVDIISSKNLDEDPLIFEHYADILEKMGNYTEAYDKYKFAFFKNFEDSNVLLSKAMSIINKIDKNYILKNISENGLDVESTSEFSLSFESKYRKFLARKTVRFSFNGFYKIEPYKNYFEALILGPLYTPLINLKLENGNFNFNSNISDERISYIDMEKYSYLISKILSWYLSGKYYSENVEDIDYTDGCFVYKSLFKDGDILKLCFDKKPFVFEKIEYDSDFKIDLNFSEFKKYIKNDKFYYIPYLIKINFGKTKITINMEDVKF